MRPLPTVCNEHLESVGEKEKNKKEKEAVKKVILLMNDESLIATLSRERGLLWRVYGP